jgi:hypothetical protein
MSALPLILLRSPHSELRDPHSADWSRFRGPNGQGVSTAPAPTAWDERSVRWAADVPASGGASPVLAGNAVVVTGTADGGRRCRALALAADTGKPLWDREVFGQEPIDGSSPGPDTKVGWRTPWDGAVLVALDAATGEEVRRANRGPSRIGHSTPVVATVGGREVLVSQGGDVVQGFDPATGGRLAVERPQPGRGAGAVTGAAGRPAVHHPRLADASDPMLGRVGRPTPIATGASERRANDAVDGRGKRVAVRPEREGHPDVPGPGDRVAGVGGGLSGGFSASLVAAGG